MKSLFEAVTIKVQEVSRATAAFCVQFPICETVRWAQLLSKLGLHLVVAVFLVLCRKVTLTDLQASRHPTGNLQVTNSQHP